MGDRVLPRARRDRRAKEEGHGEQRNHDREHEQRDEPPSKRARARRQQIAHAPAGARRADQHDHAAQQVERASRRKQQDRCEQALQKRGAGNRDELKAVRHGAQLTPEHFPAVPDADALLAAGAAHTIERLGRQVGTFLAASSVRAVEHEHGAGLRSRRRRADEPAVHLEPGRQRVPARPVGDRYDRPAPRRTAV